jgi:NADH-quinone oxidoreductase subunit H
MFISSTILAVLFFGGYNYRNELGSRELGRKLGQCIGIVALFIKYAASFSFVGEMDYPRFRYDQLMHLGWRVLIPLSIVNIIITGIVILRAEIAIYLGFK